MLAWVHGDREAIVTLEDVYVGALIGLLGPLNIPVCIIFLIGTYVGKHDRVLWRRKKKERK